MSDKLTELLQERFNGHETDVPPGAWEQVSGQLAAAASGESLRESLQDKFRGHEAQVDPSAWANISGQLGHVATTGISLGTAWLAAGVGAVVMSTALLIWNAEEKPVQIDVPTKPQIVVAEIPTTKPVEASGTAAIPEAPKTAPAQEPTPARVNQSISAAEEPVTPTVETPVPKTGTEQGQATENPVVQPSTSVSEKAPVPEKTANTDHTAAVPTAAPPAATPKTETHDGRMPENEPFTTGSTDPGQSAIDPFQKEVDPNIMIPSAFTPNGDGVNDKWKVIAPDCSKIEVVITSTSSGSVVYRSSNMNEGWDGRLPNGNVAEEGSYVYVVLLTDREGRSLKPKQGVVNLYR